MKDETVIILGGDGLLGKSFARENHSRFNIVPLSSREADITKPESLRAALEEYKPYAVINCAGLINVDYCEENQAEAFRINAEGPKNILEAIEVTSPQSIFIQISTSDVFGGQQDFYKENDKPEPVNVYGTSKLKGEQNILALGDNSDSKVYIVRTSWLYGEVRETFVDFIAKSLKKGESSEVVADQYNVTTYTGDLVSACLQLIETPTDFPSGIYHLASAFTGKPSKYDIAVFIAQVLSIDPSLIKKSEREKVFKVRRPACALLSNSSSIVLPDWKESLSRYLKA